MTANFDRSDRFELRDDLVVEEIDEEVVVLDLEGNRYFGLNEVGWDIWRDLDETEKNFGQIVDDVASRFEISTERARRDAEAFVDQLLEAGLATREERSETSDPSE